MEINKIAIYVPDEEAKKFLLFQQYYDIFNFMLVSGAFEVKKGSVTLNFSDIGRISSIEKKEFVYPKVINSA
jgi:hypothetical protein